MPSASQIVVEITPTDRASGSSSTDRLAESFADSPIHDGIMTNADVETLAHLHLQGAVVTIETGEDGSTLSTTVDSTVPSNDDGYWGFTYTDTEGAVTDGFDLNYTNAPTMDETIVDPDGYNTILSAHVPNICSPGESATPGAVNLDPSTIPEATWTSTELAADGSATVTAISVEVNGGSEWGSTRISNQASPSETSPIIAKTTIETIGSLISSTGLSAYDYSGLS